MWGNVAVTQAYLTLSEVLGHVDLLLNDGRVVEVEARRRRALRRRPRPRLARRPRAAVRCRGPLPGEAGGARQARPRARRGSSRARSIASAIAVRVGRVDEERGVAAGLRQRARGRGDDRRTPQAIASRHGRPKPS